MQVDQKFCFFFANIFQNFSIVCRFSCQTARKLGLCFYHLSMLSKTEIVYNAFVYKHVCGIDDFQVHTECYQYLCKRQTQTFHFLRLHDSKVVQIHIA